MRINSGMAKGVILNSPTTDKTRPTSDRVKESIFSVLDSSIDLSNKSILDLYAGTGALGLEAISRGATSLVCVEKNKTMCNVINENLKKVKKAIDQYETEPVDIEILNREVNTFISNKETYNKFDVIFCDPPYSFDFIFLENQLSPNGVVVYETSRSKFELLKKHLNKFEFIYNKVIGDTAIVIGSLLNT